MNSKYWQKYNLNKKKIIKKITQFNRKNNVNFVEAGHFNHTRDILALSIATITSKNKNLQILDYGSNPLSLVNLINKINTKKIFFTIYDPFYKSKENKRKINDIHYQIIKSENTIFRKKYDLIHFGSSIQYQDNFLEKIKNFKLKNTKYILITHTPFSLLKNYSSKQTNHPNLVQNIYSFSKLVLILKKKKYKLIFKSRNEDKYIACRTKKFKTYSFNLLFKK